MEARKLTAQSASTNYTDSTRVSVLAVSSHAEDLRALSRIFERSNWSLTTASNLTEAVSALASGTVAVVITDYSLPDGCWRDLEAAARTVDVAPRLLVMARSADERMWCEVLNEGAWDCLAKPFHEREVFLTVSSAWRNWKDERDRAIGRLAGHAAAGGAGIHLLARA